MDPGRYVPQQGWENNSAPEGYGAVHEPDFGPGGSYNDRRFVNERFPKDNSYSRNAHHHDALERDSYPPPPASVGPWSQARKRSYEEEYAHERESRRHDKSYAHSYNDFAHHESDKYHENDIPDSYHSTDSYGDRGCERSSRYTGRDHDDYAYDDYDYHPRVSNQNREDSRERDFDYNRRSHESDYERVSRRDGSWRSRESGEREREKVLSSREKDRSPRRHDRSWSSGRDDRSRSRSPTRSRSYGRSYREDSYDDDRYDRSERRRDRGEKNLHEHYSVAPSATVVVKGLSQKTNEEDLYQILAEWGPLRHVRVIKERNSGISRGFAFIDFPSVEAARTMMDKLGDDGLVVDERKLFFEYSKPTGGTSGPSTGGDNASKSGYHRNMTVPCDWMCMICNCVNFARRTSCFQCNEPRTDDAPPADTSSNPTSLGRRGDAGPTHVLVVRGLDENADEEMLRYEFSKHAPIKDLRLVRDKFTHVSRGFAFVHFHTVEDATKALEVTNGTALEKNGQILRVAYAKSILGQGSGSAGSSQSSRLAAAAIEASAFSQQFDSTGWAPKEYNPDNKQSAGRPEQGAGDGQNGSSEPQSGFVWDEASGYYYDASSGFYYDGNTGLYYDGNNGIWYSYDQQSQQYIPYTGQSDDATGKPSKAPDASKNRKVVISAAAATITPSEKAVSLPEAVEAAANAAMAAEKKEKEKLKEIRIASKSSILANKKKMNNVLTMWKQRSHEGQAPRVALDDNQQPSSLLAEDKKRLKTEENSTINSGSFPTVAEAEDHKPRTISNSSGGALMGVIRGSGGRGIILKSDTTFSDSSPAPSATSADSTTPFKTDASALGSYAPATTSLAVKRRFSEMPISSASSSSNREHPQPAYRDRAAERRSLYGSSSSLGGVISDLDTTDPNRDSVSKRGLVDSMPFPPGVGGGGRGSGGDVHVQSYEVITADKAIDESNVGNRMLRNMGWQEGLGLGKDGSGMVEPVQATSMDSRAGLGSRQKKAVDPSLEVKDGDSYRTLIQKKAIARFREMS
ncbi:SUPPRESSOR OF ABI3-5-like isoform X2 [Impatiens glandulifera]|uniref:SUPPRESSOR OF ABI3-5-like isoform X2 n=1 Tax=Impatiens glandulifera TaxID=253017 RepID=UPI001FB19200|nr:SUPPRESSOR OF ABI3-5-like isoform X2 [Impatiens glandulifera]